MSWPHKSPLGPSNNAILKNVYPSKKIESQSNNSTAMLDAVRARLNTKKPFGK